MIFVPDFYKKFKCIADKCADSCCIGWEIDVDGTALEKYSKLAGKLGEKLKRCICQDSDSAHFILEGERCPFLRADNLCEIIAELGEGYLCDICREHPRYYSVFKSFAIGGVGLCCEAAAKLILTETMPHTYIERTANDIEPEECDAEIFEKSCSIKKTFVDILSENSASLKEKLQRILALANEYQRELDGEDSTCDASPEVLLKDYFDGLEHLDGELCRLLSKVKAEQVATASELSAYLCNICIYFIDRYLLDAAYDGNFLGRAVLAILSTCVIGMLFEAEGLPNLCRAVEIAKCYSKEIEYSEENIERITTDSAALILAERMLRQE